ncbi:nuclear pore complex protein Nup214 isoform X2 [Agrilus planipennis]|uniref:Nuclear pore complex protein Nup214 isoform X2 n=1 Tax=Agrilus planipennis TaxID=224129 RepID=A0A1W4WP97_AGRPL|nr:nuclear pore complex protein Nup214 isoform X2 [Agrilus planipennis]
MAKTGPAPIDTQEFQFKLHSRFKVYDYKDGGSFTTACNLVAAASRYGLIFFGSNDAYFEVIQLKTIEGASLKDGENKNYERRTVFLPSHPHFLSVNCDNTKLAVVVKKDDCPVCLFYDVCSFVKNDILVVNEVRLSASPNVSITDVSWNPAIPGIFSACKNDGTLGVYEFKETGIEIKELPSDAHATCMCWSPKGKQIAIGDQMGKITQYKPDLKAARIIEAPNLNCVHTVVSLQWISNFQFMAMYKPVEPDSQSLLMVVDAPKAEPISYTNYEDICYSNGTTRPSQFYMIHISQWNVVMVSSSNSMEIGVMGFEKNHWIQWLLDDSSRAELPLSSNRQDTLPVGMVLDTGSTEPVIFGENTLPPAPYLFLMSHHGLVVCFKVLNLKTGAPTLCSPPDNLPDLSGLHHFKQTSTTVPTSIIQTKPKKEIAPGITTVIQTPFSFTPSVTSGIPASSVITTPFIFSPQNQITVKDHTETARTAFEKPVLPTFTENTVTIKKVEPLVQQSLFNIQKPQGPFTPPLTGLFGNSTFVPAPKFQESSSQVKDTVTSKCATPPTAISKTTSISRKSGEIKQDKVPPTDKIIVENVYESQEDTEALVGKMVREECEFLEAELKVLLHRARQIKVNLGTEDEIARMLQQTDSLHEFVSEVTENTASQAAEVHHLKQLVIQGWIWYEEAQSRFAASKDPTMNLLQRSQPLDPASKKQLDDIRQLLYYLETQLVQASGALDERWETFQDSCRKTLRLRIPTLENVFQTMVKQNGTLMKQKYILKDIANRIHSFRSKSKGSALLLSLDNVETLKNQLETLQLQPHSLQEMQYERIVRKQENFTASKIEKLKNHLKSQKVAHVAVNKPQLSGSFMQTLMERSTNEKQKAEVCRTLFPEKVTTLLGAGVSPIPAEKEAPVNYSPIQSTPKMDPATLRAKVIPTAQLIFSPVTKSTDLQTSTFKFSTTKPPSEQIISGFKLASDKGFSTFNTTTTVNNITVPTTNKVFVESSQATSKSNNVPPIAQSSKIITFGAPSFSSTTTSITSLGNVPLFVSSAPMSSGIFILPKTTSAVSETKSGTESKKEVILPFTSKPASLSGFTFGSAFAPTTDSANVFTAKGGSLFGSTSITPIQPPKTTISANAASATTTTTTGFNFTITPKSSCVIPSSEANKTPVSLIPSNASTSTGISFNVPAFSLQSPASTTNKSSDTPEMSKPFQISSSLTKSEPVTTSSAFTQPFSFSSPNLGNVFTSKTTSSTETTSSSLGSGLLEVNASLPVSSIEAPETAIVPINEVSTSTVTLNIGEEKKIQSTVFGGTVTSVTDSLTKSIAAVEKPETVVSSSMLNNSMIVSSSQDFTSKALTVTTSTPSLLTPASSAPQPITFGVIETSSPITASTPYKAVSSVIESSKDTVSALSQTSQSSGFATQSPTPTPAFGSMLAFDSKPLFGTTAATTATTQTTSSNVFGTTFGNAQAPFGASVTSSGGGGSNIFGGVPATTSTSFTTNGSIFGAQTANATSPFAVSSTTQSIFGTPASVQPVFGSPATTQSIFGSSNTPTGNIFGTTTNTQSVFGTAAPVTTQNAFGTPTSSIFGGSSGFGSGTTPVSITPSVFGTPSSTQSVFGTSAPVASQSSFNFASAAANIPSTTSAFGFAQKPVFESNFGSTNTTANANSFSFGNVNLGTTTSTSGFGSPAFGQTQNPFAAKPTEQKPVFGGGGSLFGKPAATTATSSIFGGGSSSTAFGSSGFNQPQSSNFGSSSAFGQPAFGQSTFGSSNFGGSPQPTGAFSGGTSGSVGQTGFGFNQQAKPAFGSGPVFGSPPAFGGAPTFGSSPVFGGSPGFGGTSKVFGLTSPTPGFGSTTQQNPTFANMANQNIGFGALAQMSSTTSTAPSFSGGSSFSSWR